jgi:hypothetical protein
MKKKAAQSILEYIIVLSAIVAAVIAMARGPVTNAVNKMFTDSSGVIEQSSTTFRTSTAGPIQTQ